MITICLILITISLLRIAGLLAPLFALSVVGIIALVVIAIIVGVIFGGIYLFDVISGIEFHNLGTVTVIVTGVILLINKNKLKDIKF